jgi:hypothetical protein
MNSLGWGSGRVGTKGEKIVSKETQLTKAIFVCSELNHLGFMILEKPP